MMRIISRVICLLFAFIIAACGGRTARMAATILYDARVQILNAKRVDVERLAPDELRETENVLLEAEAYLGQGRDDEAYRVGKKAYSMARYAEILAAQKKAEQNLQIAEFDLETARQAVDSARRDREKAESELEALTGGQ